MCHETLFLVTVRAPPNMMVNVGIGCNGGDPIAAAAYTQSR
ncbi:MAG: hypothetical protein WCC86_02650 [Methanoregula sp.]